MPISLRTACTILQNAGRLAPELKMRQRETRERILTYAQTFMAAAGTTHPGPRQAASYAIAALTKAGGSEPLPPDPPA